jgi:NitT/TauT family transport system substrate-binding protein
LLSLLMPAAGETVRIGVLNFGTLAWELEAMRSHGLDAANGIDVEVVPFAGEDASNVALLAGSVDVIVSDWLWVSRLRNEGRDLTFLPFSAAIGALMVPPGSEMRQLSDVRGRKIGVAGGPLDKNWLLIQGLARKSLGIDLVRENEIAYGAPPLLQAMVESGEIDAILTFWQFCARLEAKGFRRLLSAEDAARALGRVGTVSSLGLVFSETWATTHPGAAMGLAKASAATKDLLRRSDAEWERLARAGIVPDDTAALEVLRDRFREGIPRRSTEEEEADAAALYAILAGLGGSKLVGSSPTLASGTYWRDVAHRF